MSSEKKDAIKKLFNKMDPNGNGYVEFPEFEKYLGSYGICIESERRQYLFHLIQSMNAETSEGSTSNGKREKNSQNETFMKYLQA